MDKDEQKPVEKPIEEKPNTEINPTNFPDLKKSIKGEISKPTKDNE